MKKFFSVIFACFFVLLFVGCGSGENDKAIELMGAGDRIHDSYTFANVGVKITDDGKNVYTISGSVEKMVDENVRKEFKIAEDVTHIVAIKLTAVGEEVDKENVEIYTNGNEAYDAEHLNGSDYTFILLEVVPNNSITISVKWNKNMEKINYIVNFAEDIILK